MKNLFFGSCFFKIVILNFQWIFYSGRVYHIRKIEVIMVNYCWNHGLSKLRLGFIKYRLDKRNNKQMKIAVNSTIEFFEWPYQKYLVKVWIFLAHPPENDSPLKFFAKKFWFTINGPSKMLFFNFCLFDFSKFQITIFRNLMERPSSIIMDFENSYEVILRHNYFWSTNFRQWNGNPFKIFSLKFP